MTREKYSRPATGGACLQAFDRQPPCAAAPVLFVLRFLVLFLLVAVLSSCNGSSSGIDSGVDSSTDTDADSDTDSDVDTDTDADAGDDAGVPMTPGDYNTPTPMVWVLLDGGTFLQGSESALSPSSWSETPAHDVTVPTFEMMTTEVTTSQYAQCVLASECVEPFLAVDGDSVLSHCNWLWWGRDDHPVNCVNAYEAEAYCEWIDARLPSESEWEYAARSEGKDNEYPWGEAEPTCDLAIISAGNYQYGCGLGHTWPVSSKPHGNTDQNLCDMTGNVQEWVQDCWYGNYSGAPTDGSAWVVGSCEDNVLRGGGYKNLGNGLRTRARGYCPSFGHGDIVGFRCARSME